MSPSDSGPSKRKMRTIKGSAGGAKAKTSSSSRKKKKASSKPAAAKRKSSSGAAKSRPPKRARRRTLLLIFRELPLSKCVPKSRVLWKRPIRNNIVGVPAL